MAVNLGPGERLINGKIYYSADWLNAPREVKSEHNSVVEPYTLHSAPSPVCSIPARQTNRMRKIVRIILWTLVVWIGINMVLVVLSYFGGLI